MQVIASRITLSTWKRGASEVRGINMRTITKRLKCVNRGDTAKNWEAIEKVEARYVAKMQAKGWVVDESYRCAGNAMFNFELIIRMNKAA